MRLHRWFTLSLVGIVVCLGIAGCESAGETLDLTLVSAIPELPLPNLMNDTDEIVIRLDVAEASSSLPYASADSCGGEGEPSCCGGSGCPPGMRLQVGQFDLRDQGLELEAVFSGFDNEFDSIRLERGSLPQEGMTLTMIGRRERTGQSRMVFHAYLPRLDAFGEGLTSQNIAIEPDVLAFPPRVTDISPDPRTALEIGFNLTTLVVSFSRPVLRESLAREAAILLRQDIENDGVLVPIEVSSTTSPPDGDFVESLTLWTDDESELFDCSGTGQVVARLDIGAGIVDESGNPFDQSAGELGEQNFMREFNYTCSEDAITPPSCGTLVGERCPQGFLCVESVCARITCDGLECGLGRVCSAVTFECETDCRELGGDLFCLNGERCNEAGYCGETPMPEMP